MKLTAKDKRIKEQLPYMKLHAIRAIAKGKYRGITSTANEKALAKAELKRRGVGLEPRKPKARSTPRSSSAGFDSLW